MGSRQYTGGTDAWRWRCRQKHNRDVEMDRDKESDKSSGGKETVMSEEVTFNKFHFSIIS